MKRSKNDFIWSFKRTPPPIKVANPPTTVTTAISLVVVFMLVDELASLSSSAAVGLGNFLFVLWCGVFVFLLLKTAMDFSFRLLGAFWSVF